MQKKTSLGKRVYDIAGNNSIEQTMVNRIIGSYISTCREDLLNGHVINFFGLVSIVPDYVCSEFIGTTAWYAKKVSESTGIPYYTCRLVIKSYLDMLSNDLYENKPVDIRSIVSLHPITQDGVLCKIHAAISTSIKEDLVERNGVVTSARAHTCKLLKYKIASLPSETEVVS